MPHVLLKLASGKTENEKKDLALAIANAIKDALQCDDKFISVAIEDVAAADWMEKVYGPEIVEKHAMLVKRPGYGPDD